VVSDVVGELSRSTGYEIEGHWLSFTAVPRLPSRRARPTA
jgi:hypothetical protein